MTKLVPLVIEYPIGDAFVFTATATVPVLAVSKETFVNEFELLMAAFEPDTGMDKFLCCGQIFKYEHFIEWRETKHTPRRSVMTYDFTLPSVFTVDEWVADSLRSANYLLGEKIMQLPGAATPAEQSERYRVEGTEHVA